MLQYWQKWYICVYSDPKLRTPKTYDYVLSNTFEKHPRMSILAIYIIRAHVANIDRQMSTYYSNYIKWWVFMDTKDVFMIIQVSCFGAFGHLFQMMGHIGCDLSSNIIFIQIISNHYFWIDTSDIYISFVFVSCVNIYVRNIVNLHPRNLHPQHMFIFIIF